MKLPRATFALALATITVMALSLGLSFAHLMEAPPRLLAWPPELWRDATVFHGQYILFGIVGGPIDIAAIPLGLGLAYHLGRDDWPAFLAALGAGALFLASLVVWLAVVAPANTAMGEWQPGPLAEDFQTVRLRWETGHIAMAGLKFIGFLLAASAVLAMRRQR